MFHTGTNLHTGEEFGRHVDGRAHNAARHHCFRFTEPQVSDPASVLLIQLEESLELKLVSTGFSDTGNATEQPLAYQDVFEFYVAVDEPLTVQKSDAFNHINRHLQPEAQRHPIQQYPTQPRRTRFNSTPLWPSCPLAHLPSQSSPVLMAE